MVHKPHSLISDLLISAVILIAGLKFSFGLENALDIGLFDESAYLYRGVTLLSVGFPGAQLAPLYAIWYFIISLFEPNRISLYYLNYRLMTILPPVFVYILLRKNRVSIPISLIIAWFLLLSRAYVYTWPKVSHFALIVILSIFILVSHVRLLLWASFFASIGALLVSYVRPEYFLAYLLSLFLFLLAVVLEYRKQKRIHLTGLIVYALISIMLLVAFGLPLSGNRDIVAFGQHFSLNWVSWTRSDLNPWTNWEKIVARNFGSANSIWDAFTHNPSVFLKHITYNIQGLKRDSPDSILPTFFPTDNFSLSVAALALIGLCIAHISNILKNLREHKYLLIFIGLFLLPELVSVVVIYPRGHYLLLLCELTVVFMAILLASHTHEEEALDPSAIHVERTQLLLLGLLIIAMTPFFAGQVNVNKPNLATIRFIQSLRIDEPVNILEAEGGFHIYLGDNFNTVAEYDKNTNFYRFLRKKSINMIVVSNGLLEDTRFKGDNGWQYFLTHYSTFGYLQMDVPHTDRKLLIRADLLTR